MAGVLFIVARGQVTDKIQSVYIYGCGAAVLDVRGKGKSVTIDNCKKTQVSALAHC